MSKCIYEIFIFSTAGAVVVVTVWVVVHKLHSITQSNILLQSPPYSHIS